MSDVAEFDEDLDRIYKAIRSAADELPQDRRLRVLMLASIGYAAMKRERPRRVSTELHLVPPGYDSPVPYWGRD